MAANDSEDDDDDDDDVSEDEPFVDDGYDDEQILQMDAQKVRTYTVEPLLIVGLRRSMKAYRAVQTIEKQLEAIQTALQAEPKTLVSGRTPCIWQHAAPTRALVCVYVCVRACVCACAHTRGCA